MRILLVGGLGFIGRYVIRALAEANNLIVFSNAEAATRNEAFVRSYGLRVEVGDITDATSVTEVMLRHRPDVVIHLAALTGIAKCNENPSLAFSVNVLGTYNVIMGCVAYNSRMIFISSREVYGETTSDQTREDDPLVPNNIYGITKLLGERLTVWAASKFGLDYTILRLTNVYGPEGDQYNLQAMIQNALTKGTIRILGGTQRMNFIYVEDVAEAVQRCTVNPQASRQTFNVGSEDSITVLELAKRIASFLQRPVHLEYAPMREGETSHFQPSLMKIQKTLGFTSQTSLEEGLKKTVKWYISDSKP